ncbi:MAG: hypothetical protein WC292_05370 [Clostridia bacterium]
MSKLNGLQCAIRNKYARIRSIFLKNKLHFYICFACIAVGCIFAASGDYADVTKSSNFIADIVNGTFSPFLNMFLIGLFTSLLFFAVFCAGLRFWLFLVSGYGGLLVAAYLMCRTIIIAFAVDGFWGFIYFILFLLPIFLFNCLMYILALARVYEISGYRHNRKCLVGLRSQSRLLFESIKKFWLYCLLFNYILWLLIMLIFIIIF